VSTSTREAILKVMDSDGFNRDESGQFHHGFTMVSHFPLPLLLRVQILIRFFTKVIWRCSAVVL
jgi:hypothetical protein